MRHSIRPPVAARGETVARLAAAERALERERTRFALFITELLENQETSQARVRRYDERMLVQEQQQRNLAARQWRLGRKMLMEAPQAAREQTLAAWNASSIPADAEYFADFVWRALRDRGLLPASQDDNA